MRGAPRRRASSSWSRSENVSRTITSTPPSSRPSICSRNAARALGLRDGRPAARRRPERSDGAADERVASADLASLAGELRRPPVELADLPSRPHAASRWRLAPKRQGLDQLGAGLEVLAVGGADQLRLADDELLEAGALGHAAAEQERAHPAVDQERPRREPAPEARPRQAGGRIGRQAGEPSGRGTWTSKGSAWVRENSVIGERDRKTKRPFLRGRVRGGPLSRRRTCPELAPCRRRRR